MFGPAESFGRAVMVPQSDIMGQKWQDNDTEEPERGSTSVRTHSAGTPYSQPDLKKNIFHKY